MPPPMPYWPEDTDPDHDVPVAADARDQPRDVQWPDKAHPDGPPRPLTVERIAGRYPRFPGALKQENCHVQVTEWEPGLVVIRIEDGSRGREDHWLEVTVRLPR